MEISHASDGYGRHFSDIFGHLPNMARCMEDLVVYTQTYIEHLSLLHQLFQMASNIKVSFNTQKKIFAKQMAIFAGYKV